MKKKTMLKIRNAGFEDVSLIYSLIKKHPEALLPRSTYDIAQNIDRFIICESNGTIIGTASWEILPELGKLRDPSVELKSVVVDDEFQGKGVGQAMVMELIGRVKAFHPSRIIVLTFSPDFFRKMGFRETPKKKLMHKLYIGCASCTKFDSPFTCPEIAMALTVKRPKKTK